MNVDQAGTVSRARPVADASSRPRIRCRAWPECAAAAASSATTAAAAAGAGSRPAPCDQFKRTSHWLRSRLLELGDGRELQAVLHQAQQRRRRAPLARPRHQPLGRARAHLGAQVAVEGRRRAALLLVAQHGHLRGAPQRGARSLACVPTLVSKAPPLSSLNSCATKWLV